MVSQLAIFNSDQVSLDGKQFSIAALEDGIWLASIYGVPSNYSHDLHRPVGWSYARGLYFEHEKVLTIGYFLIAENEGDLKEVNKARKIFFQKMLFDQINPHIESFKKSLDKLFVDNGGTWFFSSVALYGYENIVNKAFPQLEEHIRGDKNHLVNLSYLLEEFNYLGQGIFKSKNTELCIIAHPYFRKSLSIHNNFHWMFLDELIGLHGTPGIKLKLKIDLNFIGFAPSYLPVHEFEYWWGPKYNDDITAIQPGLTQYASDDFERDYYQIDRTEFVWKQEGNLYTLELEEVKDEPAPTMTDTYGCRYVHSIFDSRKNGFDHFDGAIRSYDSELMIERMEKKMTEMGRRSQYTKLFRVDGNLPLANWKSLVTNYLQGNPQIYEYFGLPKPGVQELVEPAPDPTILEKYIPYSISKDQGIRLYVSYHQKVEEKPSERYFSSFDLLRLEDGQHKMVEHFTVDVKKALNSVGAEILLPDDCLLYSPEDFYHNVPCIHHSNNNLQVNINKTVEGLRFLITNLVNRKNNHVLSLTLAWNWEDRKVSVSVVGHIGDLLKWLNSFQEIPIDRTKFKSWLEQQAVIIKSFGANSKTPVLAGIIRDDGMLYLKRRLVHQDAELHWPEGADFMKPTMKIDVDKEDLVNAIQQGTIYPAPALIIKKMICRKSGMDYSLSPYSIYFGPETGQDMKDAQLVAFHWSDKPRPVKIAD